LRTFRVQVRHQIEGFRSIMNHPSRHIDRNRASEKYWTLKSFGVSIRRPVEGPADNVLTDHDLR
jgi:hypothetical protein